MADKEALEAEEHPQIKKDEEASTVDQPLEIPSKQQENAEAEGLINTGSDATPEHQLLESPAKEKASPDAETPVDLGKDATETGKQPLEDPAEQQENAEKTSGTGEGIKETDKQPLELPAEQQENAEIPTDTEGTTETKEQTTHGETATEKEATAQNRPAMEEMTSQSHQKAVAVEDHGQGSETPVPVSGEKNREDTSASETASPTYERATEEEAKGSEEAEIEVKEISPPEVVPVEAMSKKVNLKPQDFQAHRDVAARPKVNLDATVTVKFVLMPSTQVVTMACTLGKTLFELKTHFASELKMAVNLITMAFGGRTMPDTTTLADLGVGPNGTVQLEMQSTDPVNNPIRSYRPHQEYQMPDVITVRVQTEDGEAKDVVVEIERATSRKPFLGGYRHKVNGLEFHNAAAQTVHIPRAPTGIDQFCRNTQTLQVHNKVLQTFKDTSTQMTGIGVYISNLSDKLMTPKRYVTADTYRDNILQKVIILQKYYRRWLATRYVNKLKADRKRREDWERQQIINKQKEKEDRIRQEFERRMHPKTREDFDLLYHALEKWRLEELERINSTLTGAERKVALCMLLDQETELLAAIDRHKQETVADNRERYIQEFLNNAAAPKKWRGFDGKPTEMDTPYTMRAKELRDIYNSINMKYLTQDERLDVLLTLKHTVKEHDCKLTEEIIELIDREADLLMRGVRDSNLTGLRKRIATLFLQYIKTPTFNPEAARLLKVPQDPATLRKNIYFCSSCNKYLPTTEFPLMVNTRTVGRCRNCEQIDNDARMRQESSHYRKMLKALRRCEDAFQDGSQIAFLLQENDLRYLVENIWNGQSILSSSTDFYDLILVRWDRHNQWSPWNCILLSHDEAKAHDKLARLDEGYGDVFMQKIKQKHTLARNYFSRLPGMAELMRMHAADNTQSIVPGPSSLSGHALTVHPQKA